jgi:hypothetical protein
MKNVEDLKPEKEKILTLINEANSAISAATKKGLVVSLNIKDVVSKEGLSLGISADFFVKV